MISHMRYIIYPESHIISNVMNLHIFFLGLEAVTEKKKEQHSQIGIEEKLNGGMDLGQIVPQVQRTTSTY